jgi:hypothetical protein
MGDLYIMNRDMEKKTDVISFRQYLRVLGRVSAHWSLKSHRWRSESVSELLMSDSWWVKWHWGRLFSKYFVYYLTSASYRSNKSSAAAAAGAVGPWKIPVGCPCLQWGFPTFLLTTVHLLHGSPLPDYSNIKRNISSILNRTNSKI